MSDRSKLPKWAQQELTQQDRDIAKLKQQVDLLQATNTGGKTRVEVDTDGDPVYAPSTSRVLFHLGESTFETVQAYLARDSVTGRYKLQISGNDSVSIEPSATNAFLISVPQR